jgi:hypothetical protein
MHATPAQPIRVLLYGLRWLCAVLLLEVLTRLMYVNAIAKHGLLTTREGLFTATATPPPNAGDTAPVITSVTPLHFALVGFWVLVFMWLKVSAL